MTKEEIFKEYLENVFEVGVSNTLGSSQYKTIEDTFKFITQLFNDEGVGVRGVEKMFGITHDGVASLDYIEEYLYTDLIKMFDVDIDGDLFKEYEHLLLFKDKRCTIENYYSILKDEGYDLWGAFKYIMINFKMNDEFKAPTFGLEMNKVMQEENFYIGVGIAYYSYFYNIDISVFGGFDT